MREECFFVLNATQIFFYALFYQSAARKTALLRNREQPENRKLILTC